MRIPIIKTPKNWQLFHNNGIYGAIFCRVAIDPYRQPTTFG